MAETENEKQSKDGEGESVSGTEEKKKLTPILFLAIPLALGSLIWTTYSLLDFFQVGGVDVANLKDLSIVGLSAAATADIAWSATMLAEYREVRITRARLGFGGEDAKQKNLLPYIGWIEVLLVTVMLYMHGKSMGNGAAAFAAALPILTKIAWMMVISDLKDESDLTDEQKRQIAESRRANKLLREKIEAAADKHAANMEQMRRENEALREQERAKAEAEVELARLEAEKERIAMQSQFEREEEKLRRENDIKALRQRLTAELEIEMLKSRTDIQVMRFDAEQMLALRGPIGGNTIIGQVVRPQRQIGSQTADGGTGEQDASDSWMPSLVQFGLTDAEMRKAALALNYYTINAQHGGTVTKSDFCRANRVNPPRLSEATGAFPAEWFAERGLATWIN